MLCINSGSHLDDPDRFKFDGEGYYMRSAQQMRELFRDLPEACDNTIEVAERCNVMFDDHEDGAFMPKFPCPEGWDETSLFLKKVEEGLERRYEGNVPAHVLAQADYECGVICQMQFPGYLWWWPTTSSGPRTMGSWWGRAVARRQDRWLPMQWASPSWIRWSTV